MAVRLVQLLCPHRHCVMAAAYEEDMGSFEQTCQFIRDMMKAMHIEESCWLCRSRELRIEDTLTKFQTMTEAAPHFLFIEQQHLRTRTLIETMRSAQRN